MLRIIALSFVPTTFAWTGAIHYEIMMNAYNQATPSARRFLRHHLGDDVQGIAEASKWADSEDARVRYPKSEEFHFSHTPYRNCSKFVLERDCGFNGSGKCLVTGIAEMVMRATDIRLSLSDRADAIKFLLHLVADIHQPLHTGFARDAGGVSVKINVTPAMSLHQLWDFVLLQPEFPIGASEPPSRIQLSQSFANERDIIEYASLLASESSTLYTCKSAYQFETGAYIESSATPSAAYSKSRARIANDRMSHAATRLADLLDVLGPRFFEERARSVSKPKRATTQKKCDSSNCFAVLAFDFAPDEVADICQDSLQLHQPQFTPLTVEPGEETLSEIDALEEAMAQAAREHAARDSAQRAREREMAAVTTVQGVELSSIVMIKKNARFFITKKEFLIRNPSYPAFDFLTYKVQFTSDKKSRFHEFDVDGALFASLSELDLTRILFFLKNGEHVSSSAKNLTSARGAAAAPGESDLIRSVQLPNGNSRGDAVGLCVADGFKLEIPEPDEDVRLRYEEGFNLRRSVWLQDFNRNPSGWLTQEQKSYRDFMGKFKSIVLFDSPENKIKGFFHRDTLITTNCRRRFNVFSYRIYSEKPSQVHKFYLILDTALHDGFMTEQIHKALQGIDTVQDPRFKPDETQRRTLKDEMIDLNEVLYSGNSRKMRIIKNLWQHLIFPIGTHRSLNVLEWEIKPNAAPGVHQMSLVPEASPPTPLRNQSSVDIPAPSTIPAVPGPARVGNFVLIVPAALCLLFLFHRF